MSDHPSTHVTPTMTVAQHKYWGVWATLTLTLLIFILFSIFQLLLLLVYILVTDSMSIDDALQSDSTAGLKSVLANYALNGDAISVSQIPSALIGIALVMIFILIRDDRIRKVPRTIMADITEYLGLYKPTLKHVFLFLGLMIVAMVLIEAINSWLNRPTPEFMIRLYSSTENLPLLWIAVGISAPFFEEILFRGFFFEGLKNSAFGTVGAILLTSASWAIIHTQYGWFEIVSIFLIGILLAIAKLKTNSLYIPIAMHMLMNISACIGMELNS